MVVITKKIKIPATGCSVFLQDYLKIAPVADFSLTVSSNEAQQILI